MKKRVELLISMFLLFIVMVLSAYASGCSDLNCESQGKKCVVKDSAYQCVDYCSEDNILAAAGDCSVDFRYCNPDSKQFESNKCDICGCPPNNKCSIDGKCYGLCSDGTMTGECSAVHLGQSCFASTPDPILVDDCMVCGVCPTGEVCNPQSECAHEIFWTSDNYDDFIKGSSTTMSVSHEPINLAPLGEPFASSLYVETHGVEWIYYPDVSGLNDGKILWEGPEWISKEVFFQFAGINWSRPVKFNKVSFIQSTQTIQSYQIQYLKDDEWVSITPIQRLPYYPVDCKGGPGNPCINVEGRAEEIVFETVESTAMRILMPTCTKGFGCRIAEMMVYDTEPVALKLDANMGEYVSDIFDSGAFKGDIIYNKIYFDITGILLGSSGPLVGSGSSSGLSMTSSLSRGLKFNINFDDGTYLDKTGSGVVGTCSGTRCPSLTNSGISGKARSFDGGDYIEFGNPASLRFSNDFTVSVWYKSNINGAYQGIVSKYHGTSVCGWIIWKNNANRFGFYTQKPASNMVSSKIYSDTNWHHIVGVMNGGIKYLYVDGELAAQAAATITECTNIRIGATYANTLTYLARGVIDEVRIYDRPLQGYEIKALYDLGVSA